jgi:hypothetical protein
VAENIGAATDMTGPTHSDDVSPAVEPLAQPGVAQAVPALGSPGPTAQRILALQRAAGNHAVAALIASRGQRPAADCHVELPPGIDQSDGGGEEAEDATAEGAGPGEEQDAGVPADGAEVVASDQGAGLPTGPPSENSPVSQSRAKPRIARARSQVNPWAAESSGPVVPEAAWASRPAIGNGGSAAGALWADPRRLAAAIAGPSGANLPKIQNMVVFDAGRVGATGPIPPANLQAPQFDFNVTSKANAKGVTEFFAKPTLTQSAKEGDADCWFLPAGTHKTTLTEGGKPVFWKMTAAMSALDAAAEAEHSSDLKRAFKISIKEAHNVLVGKVVGKTFGPKASEAEVKQLVLDRIKGNLTHPQLGEDQTKWEAQYIAMTQKTLGRDAKGWHTFHLGNRKTNKAGDVFYTLTKGTTNVGTVGSAQVVKY